MIGHHRLDQCTRLPPARRDRRVRHRTRGDWRVRRGGGRVAGRPPRGRPRPAPALRGRPRLHGASSCCGAPWALNEGPVTRATPLEARIARLLMVGTYLGRGPHRDRGARDGVHRPLTPGHRAELRAGPPRRRSWSPLQPAGFLWLGVLVVLATPRTRVVAALAGFIRVGEREMAFVAGAIVAVVLTGCIVGTVTPQARG